MRKLWPVLLLASLSSAGQTFVVAAGVEECRDRWQTTRRFANDDARAVAQAFRAAGVPEANLTVLTSGQRPWRRESAHHPILWALESVCDRAVTGDTVIFYFAGPSCVVDDVSYLLPTDCSWPPAPDRALDLRWVAAILHGLRASHLLYLLDADGRQPQDGSAAVTFAQGFRAMRDHEAGGAGPRAALLLASGRGGCVHLNEDAGHGTFTWALLNGLNGAAVGPDGKVTLRRLADYVTAQTERWARRQGLWEMPLLDDPDGEDFVVLRPGGQSDPGTAEEAAPMPSGRRPDGWPEYLADYRRPAEMNWSSFRVSPRDGMPQVFIPAGEYVMGSGWHELGFYDNRPQRLIYVSAFWMDLHEVTVGQYRRFCTAAGRKMDTEWNKEDGHPVVMVSWDDATAYASWAGKRLSTEAEWEKAARGGRFGRLYYWGDEWPPPPGAGNFSDEQAGWKPLKGYSDPHPCTAPVGSYTPNGYGLLDMEGNVWEWCLDWAGLNYAGMPARDPVCTTPSRQRRRRGGCFDEHDENYRTLYRPAARFAADPDYPQPDLGFRCVSVVTGAGPAP